MTRGGLKSRAAADAAAHRHLEAVAKVDVEDLARQTVEHQVGRVAVAEAEDVAHHAHHRERARVVRPAREPVLRVERSQPEHLGDVLAVGLLQRVLEGLELVQDGQPVVVWRELEHQPVLDVENRLRRRGLGSSDRGV